MQSTTLRLRDLSQSVFRSSPQYQLTDLDSLDGSQLASLGIAAGNDAVAALLLPAARAGLGIKAVDAKTAALLRALNTPGPIPSGICPAWSSSANSALARLVLDGLIEIEHAGRFLAGAAAQTAVLEGSAQEGAQGRLARLALDAIRHVQALRVADVGTVAAHLYHYNRLPVSGRWLALWPDAGSVLQHGGHDEARMLRVDFVRVDFVRRPQQQNAWILWRSRDPALALPVECTVFKLYVSVLPGAEREVFDTIVRGALHGGCAAFKIGADAYGLLRPDKMILYFRHFQELQSAASWLAQELRGGRAFGVPFSSELTADGLLSWGIDPPRIEALGLADGVESWRLRVAHRLAHALVMCHDANHEPGEVRRFALTRLELEGIDTRNWTPFGVCDATRLE